MAVMDPVIVILISGNGSNLQALIDAYEKAEIPGRIGAVISNNASAYGLTRANKANIPAKVVDHTQYEMREMFDAHLIRAIDEYEPDLVVLAGFMRILTDDFVRRYEGKLINIHPSLLPLYPGLHTHQRALNNSDKEHGLTVHFVIPKLDAGPNIIQAKVPVTDHDNIATLQNRVQEKEHIIYPIAVKWFVEGRLLLDSGKAKLDGKVLPQSGLILESGPTLH